MVSAPSARPRTPIEVRVITERFALGRKAPTENPPTAMAISVSVRLPDWLVRTNPRPPMAKSRAKIDSGLRNRRTRP